ncbi:GNAT family N-acetyltransferase [Roseibium sp.]|uniref:GNAT family N-acetyltransferase n=1 Tax=Roseibium sp. TaxID=1936156 RepID=UPI003B5185A7
MPLAPISITLAPAVLSDGDQLADLRLRAMRPSLEAIGRFDPIRARTRFLSNYSPSDTQKILFHGELAGFFVVRENPDHLYLDHFYIRQEVQGRGIGRQVLSELKTRAQRSRFPIRLIALAGSAANAFYLSNGFEAVGRDDVDVQYQWISD